jgi:hypothetical protein
MARKCIGRAPRSRLQLCNDGNGGTAYTCEVVTLNGWRRLIENWGLNL